MGRIGITLLLFLGAGALAADGPVKDPKLAQEIQARTVRDQDARFALLRFEARVGWNARPAAPHDPKQTAEHQQLLDRMRTIDHDNTTWLRQVVDRQGWPGQSLVGKDSAHLAWLLVQHADRDRPFQKKCLGLMRALPRGEVDPRDLAYLVDRVAVGEGKKQTYGTQLKFHDGKLVPQTPIEDAANVDRRRAAVGMQPLKDYIAFCEKMMRHPGEPLKPKKE